MGFGVRLLWGATLFHCLHGAVLADPPISFGALKKIAEEQAVELNLPVLPSTAEEVRAVSKRVRTKIDRAIDRIMNRPAEAASFSNTVLAFDSLMNDLDEASSQLEVMLCLDSVGPLAADVRNEQLKLAKMTSEIYLNAKIYDRLKSFSEMEGLDAENGRLLEVMLDSFSARPKHLKQVIDSWEMNGLSDEIGKQTARFGENLYKREPLRFRREELKGLPSDKLERLTREGDDFLVDGGRWVEYSAILATVEVEATRRQVWLSANAGAPDENNQLLDLILAGRARMAHRLGYRSWGEHNLDATSATAQGLLIQFARLKQATTAAFHREKRELTERLGRKPQPWDIAFVAEQMSREAGIDEGALRQYFEFESVLDAMLKYSETIFGIRIRAIQGAPFWPEARAYAIFNAADGMLLGTFAIDPFVRPGKEPWYMEIRMANAEAMPGEMRELSSALLHCSFAAPGADGKTFLAFGEATTLFHEFGHVLHEIFPNQRRFFLGPDAANADLIEFPSVLLESLAREPEVIRLYAKHHLTGAPMPEEMIRALTLARRILPAHSLRQRLADSVLDLKLHGARPRKASAVEREVYGKYYYSLPRGVTTVGSNGYLIDYDAFSWIYSLSAAMAARQIELFRSEGADLTRPGMAMGIRKGFYEVGALYSSTELVKRTMGKSFRLCASLLKAAGLASEPSKKSR